MKDTFILKTKYGSIINRLSDKQAGVLFKMLFNYVENGANAGSTDERVDMACLLYTSPSPRDSTSSRMPSSA